MATAGKGAGAGAWGRFALVSKERPAESDHVYFSRAQHKIGRSAERCDIVLDLQYISSVVRSPARVGLNVCGRVAHARGLRDAALRGGARGADAGRRAGRPA